MFQVARSGDLEALKKFTDLNLISKDRLGYTVFHYATISGHIDSVKYLLDRKADVNVKRDEYHQTPLHIASKLNFYEMIEFLCKHGALVNNVDRRGHTPLFVAAESGNDSVCKFLLEKKANIDYQSKKGWSALHVAVRQMHISTALLLIKQSANMKIQTNRGYTIIHIAAEHGPPSMLEMLLKQVKQLTPYSGMHHFLRFNENTMKKQFRLNKFILQKTCMMMRPEVPAIINFSSFNEKSKGISKKKVPEDTLTPLMVAAVAGRNECVLQLLQARAAPLLVRIIEQMRKKKYFEYIKQFSFRIPNCFVIFCNILTHLIFVQFSIE